MTARTHHWAQLGETTFVSGIWLLYGVHRLFGRRLVRWVMFPVVLVHWLTRPALRRASLAYLRHLHRAEPGLFPREPGWLEGLRHVGCFAETMLDKLLAMADRYPTQAVRERDFAIVDALLSQGRGGIFITAHMGCLELCRMVAKHRQGLHLTVLVHTRHAQAFNRILKRLDPTSAVNLLEVTDFGPGMAQQLAALVSAGGWVAIAGDRVPINSAQTVTVDFLGAPAPFPVGAYVLAGVLQCPLVLLTCLHQGEGYEVRFEMLAEQVALPRAGRAQALAQYAQTYARILQRRLRESPYDWFNFYAFWHDPHGSVK
jgi:predicted LPLAT superfamily acyltransferase